MTIADFVNVLLLILVALIVFFVYQMWHSWERRASESENGSPSALNPLTPSIPAEILEQLNHKAQKERWRSLSSTEQKVARLATYRQNGEIAQTLGVHKSTVGTHMKKIYRTLGVHTRRELRNFLQEIDELAIPQDVVR